MLLTDEDNLMRIFALLRERARVDFTYYKPSTVARRIERRIAIYQLQDLRDYVRYMEANLASEHALPRTADRVTSFFATARCSTNWKRSICRACSSGRTIRRHASGRPAVPPARKPIRWPC